MANDLDYAIVIGIEHYQGMTPLGGPHKDSIDFLNWLTTSTGGNIPTANGPNGEDLNILQLLSTPEFTPIKDDVDDWLNNTINKLQQTGKRGRRLYFYFSGHGIGQNQTNSAMLLPKWTTSNRNYALSSEKYLLELVNKGLFEEIYFFMDCCRNRIPGVQGQSPTWGAPAPSGINTEYFLQYASEFDAPSFEVGLGTGGSNESLDNLLPRGLLTNILLTGLSGAAANRNGTLRVIDLLTYVKLKLPELAKSKGKKQVPKYTMAIDPDREITGPFAKTIDVLIEFKTVGIAMILEDPELNIVQQGDSATGPWQLSLRRGEYTLRKADELSGQVISIDGTQQKYII